ncbi:MAG: hypothetical protein AAB649_02285 [Patescibacteria group bacterium]
MPKKSQTKNTKMILLGGGAIIVLGLLLVGTYGNSLTTMVSQSGDSGRKVGIDGGEERPMNRGENSEQCIAARNRYNNEIEIMRQICTAPPLILLPYPQGPSQACLDATERVNDAERDMHSICDGPPAPPADDEYEPPSLPEPYFTPPPSIDWEQYENPPTFRILPLPEDILL